MAKPIKNFRDGTLEVAVFENNGYLSATITRSYKDKQTGEWKHTNSLYDGDLLKLANLATQAYEWMNTQTKQAQKQQSQTADPFDF